MDYKTFVQYAERFPVNNVELWYLILGVGMILVIFACLLTTGKRLLQSDHKFMKIKGWFLILLVCGQLIVAQSCIERAVSGLHNEYTLLIGITLWVLSRVALSSFDTGKCLVFKYKRYKQKK